MRKVLLWGFGTPGCIKIPEHLKKGGLDVVIWVGNHSQCTHNIFDFFTVKLGDQFSGRNRGLYKEVYKKIGTFVELYSRHSKKYQQYSYHDFTNIFNIYYDRISDLLIKNNIEYVVFSNIPHEGPDYILYMLAKLTGIQIWIFSQSLFPNKYFIISNIDDYGIFAGTPVLTDETRYQIDREFEKHYPYMENIRPYSFGVNQIVDKVLRWRLKEAYLSVWRYFRYRRYLTNMRALFERSIVRGEKYVYFPLHLQPELTTSILGGIFSDQLTAIEELSCQLPEGWTIYVKENPKQTEAMRGEYFFNRLRSIRNVKYLDSSWDTYDLIRNSQFVSTIAGTVGWEAISGGKNVLIFGNAWYGAAPGVYKYNGGIDFKLLQSGKINHKELERYIGSIFNKMGFGILDKAYIDLYPEYDPVENAAYIANTIQKLA